VADCSRVDSERVVALDMTCLRLATGGDLQHGDFADQKHNNSFLKEPRHRGWPSPSRRRFGAGGFSIDSGSQEIGRAGSRLNNLDTRRDDMPENRCGNGWMLIREMRVLFRRLVALYADEL